MEKAKGLIRTILKNRCRKEYHRLWQQKTTSYDSWIQKQEENEESAFLGQQTGEEEKIVFLRKLFDSASALYGIISLCDLWEVYKEYSQKAEAVKIHRKDILSFSSIARREVHDYYIYEID